MCNNDSQQAIKGWLNAAYRSSFGLVCAAGRHWRLLELAENDNTLVIVNALRTTASTSNHNLTFFVWQLKCNLNEIIDANVSNVNAVNSDMELANVMADNQVHRVCVIINA